MSQNIETRLSKAKTSLILEHPFIGTIALNMPFRITDEVKTAATDGSQVLFNPDFVSKQSDEELKFLVAHECMHPMLEHTTRRNGRDPYKWNMAGDYVINQLLADEHIGRMPSGGLLDPNIYKNGDGTTDGIYNLIPDHPQGGNGDGEGYGGENQPFDECRDSGSTPHEISSKQAEWKVKVAQAAQAAKMMGKLSAGLERLVSGLLKPRVDWRDVLARFVQRAKNDERSWARPNRRFVAQGMYLPSVSGEAMGEIAIAVDCSGSINEEEINQFASEIRAIQQDSLPAQIHVIYFDSKVSHYEAYGPNDELDIKPHGGGGTAFSPVFSYMAERDINPVACVFLTDLYCDDFGSEQEFPVLWVTTGKEEAPFGEVVKMNKE